jgi:hypothetical protein
MLIIAENSDNRPVDVQLLRFITPVCSKKREITDSLIRTVSDNASHSIIQITTQRTCVPMC